MNIFITFTEKDRGSGEPSSRCRQEHIFLPRSREAQIAQGSHQERKTEMKIEMFVVTVGCERIQKDRYRESQRHAASTYAHVFHSFYLRKKLIDHLSQLRHRAPCRRRFLLDGLERHHRESFFHEEFVNLDAGLPGISEAERVFSTKHSLISDLHELLLLV